MDRTTSQTAEAREMQLHVAHVRPLRLNRPSHSRAYAVYVKSFFDRLFSLIGFLLLIPLFAVVAAAIRLDSKGPALFKQERVGQHGRVFTIYKFRTMYVDTPVQQISPDSDKDPRITRIGRILRKTSIDELPQLLNILRGDMSFVGPRPEQKMIVDTHYTSYERQRFLVKPGLTGYWQISADRKKMIHENLHHDFDYIERMSLARDLEILLKTAKVIVKSNTY